MAGQRIGKPRGRVSERDTALADQKHLSGRAQEVPAGVAIGRVASVEVEPCACLANRLIAAAAERSHPARVYAFPAKHNDTWEAMGLEQYTVEAPGRPKGNDGIQMLDQLQGAALHRYGRLGVVALGHYMDAPVVIIVDVQQTHIPPMTNGQCRLCYHRVRVGAVSTVRRGLALLELLTGAAVAATFASAMSDKTMFERRIIYPPVQSVASGIAANSARQPAITPAFSDPELAG